MTLFRTKRDLIEALIAPSDTVLDIGFWGQGTSVDSPEWVHTLLRARAKEVWGIDIEYDESRLPGSSLHYRRASAESFSLPEQFSVLFAGDLIEHLSNPGLFLARAKEHLATGGRLILSTPNAFNLFNIAEKFSKGEPTVNRDHTCYFNEKTLRQLLRKNGWRVTQVHWVYSLGTLHKESWKKQILNVFYALLARVTPRFIETIVVVAEPDES